MVRRFYEHLRDHYLVEVVNDCEAARAASIEKFTLNGVQKRLAWLVLGIIACLMFVRFAGNENELKWIDGLLRALGMDTHADSFTKAIEARSPEGQIWRRVWWAAARVTGYGVLPILIARALTGMTLADLGLGFGELRKHLKVYAFVWIVMMPSIVLASYGKGFQAKYPYYKLGPNEALWPNFILWECLYTANFAALELYFRGFSIRALRPLIGYASIFLMMAPYAMIHFGKPLPEAIGSVITGFVLGTLSVKHRSIWGGVFLHVSAALAMDWLSLWHQGRL